MMLTSHAAKRWQERFPEFNITHEFNSAKQCGKGTKRKIRLACAAHAEIMMGFNGVYYLMSSSRIVFVCTPPEKIITVFQLDK